MDCMEWSLEIEYVSSHEGFGHYVSSPLFGPLFASVAKQSTRYRYCAAVGQSWRVDFEMQQCYVSSNSQVLRSEAVHRKSVLMLLLLQAFAAIDIPRSLGLYRLSSGHSVHRIPSEKQKQYR